MPRTITAVGFSPESRMPSRPDRAEGLAGPGLTPLPEEWWQVSLRVQVDLVEPTTALFEAVTPGGVSVDWPFQQGDSFGTAELDASAEARVSCYVPSKSAPALVAALRAHLRELGRTDAARRLETVRRRRAEWETAFQRFLRPIHVGRLLVRPWPCAEVPREGEVVVDLKPGLAFGTGQHPSTRMALAALVTWVRPGDVVLDFGAGSGVLSCAAARLGAKRVVAVDVDSQSIAATRHNARRNAAEHIVEVRQADTPAGSGGPYDVVVANISARVIEQALPVLAAATRPGGHCLLGGIIDAQVERLQRAMAALPNGSLEVQEVCGDGEWRSLHTARAASVH